jgi:hypothetical protein
MKAIGYSYYVNIALSLETAAYAQRDSCYHDDVSASVIDRLALLGVNILYALHGFVIYISLFCASGHYFQAGYARLLKA